MIRLRVRRAMPLDATESHRNTRQPVRQLQCTSLKTMLGSRTKKEELHSLLCGKIRSP